MMLPLFAITFSRKSELRTQLTRKMPVLTEAATAETDK